MRRLSKSNGLSAISMLGGTSCAAEPTTSGIGKEHSANKAPVVGTSAQPG
jgi:hypothetical protein